VEWLMNADDPRVQAALAWSCDICKAPKKTLCTNPIEAGAPLPGRLVHIGRLTDRRPPRKGNKGEQNTG